MRFLSRLATGRAKTTVLLCNATSRKNSPLDRPDSSIFARKAAATVLPVRKENGSVSGSSVLFGLAMVVPFNASRCSLASARRFPGVRRTQGFQRGIPFGTEYDTKPVRVLYSYLSCLDRSQADQAAVAFCLHMVALGCTPLKISLLWLHAGCKRLHFGCVMRGGQVACHNTNNRFPEGEHGHR